MEKLINILPNLITNEDSNWLKDATPNPDVLTRDLLENFDKDINKLAIMHASDDFEDLPYTIEEHASYREIISAIAASSMQDKDSLVKLFSEVGKQYDTEGLSAFATIWIAAMLNNLKDMGAKQESIQHIFLAAGLNLKNYDLKISDVHKEVSLFMEKNPDISEAFADFIAYAFMLNPEVQDSENWFNFKTLESIETSPDMQVNSREALIEALKSSRNYLAAIEYVKNTYLNDKEEGEDGYCANEEERDYKAYLIVAKLASEIYGKNNPTFDEDNTIGLNIVSQVITLQDKIESNGHMLSGLTNHINMLEDAAGRIADTIMGREKLSARFGDTKEYILNHFNAFNLLAKNGSAKLNSNIIGLSRLRDTVEGASRRVSAHQIEKLHKYADDVDVELAQFDEKLRGSEFNAQVLAEIDRVTLETYKKYNHTQQLVKLLASLKRKNGTNLDIQDVDLKATAKKSTLVTPWQESVIRQFYDTIKTDPILKSDISVYRLKSPSIVLSEIRQRLATDPDKYPELASLFDVLKQPSKNTKLKDKAEDMYLGNYGLVRHENHDLYKTLTDKNSTREEKANAINESSLPKDEKDAINDLL